jgi:hypothetical protein
MLDRTPVRGYGDYVAPGEIRTHQVSTPRHPPFRVPTSLRNRTDRNNSHGKQGKQAPRGKEQLE